MVIGGARFTHSRRRRYLTRRTATVTLVFGAVLFGALTIPAAAPAAPAAPTPAAGTLSTFAGGVGWGPGTNVGQSPVGIGILGDRVLEVDGVTSSSELPAIDASYPAVVRAIDPATGLESVIAGNGVGGFSGDGGPAVRAALGSSDAVAGDGAGNVYVGDSFGSRIRKVAPTGIITTLAGTGSRGFSGDGGPATDAALNWPLAIAVAPDGAVVFADASNGRVRRVGPDGVISTIAGDGTMGDDTGSRGDGGPAVQAQLRQPGAVAFGPGGVLYIADLGDLRIRTVRPDGTITTFAHGSAGLGIAVGVDGDVLVTYGSTIRSIDSAGAATTIAGVSESSGGFSGDGGPATQAALDFPRDVAADAAGNVYVADSGNKRVRRITTDGVITTIGGNGMVNFGGDGGPAVAAQLRVPSIIRTGPEGMFIADAAHQRLRHVDPAGVITTIREPAPRGMAVDGDGNLYLSETNRVVKRARDGTVTAVAGNGETGHGGDGVPATAATLSPQALALDGDGTLYIVDTALYQTRIRRVDASGVITTVAGAEPAMDWPVSPELAQHTLIDVDDLAVGPDGALYLLRSDGIDRIRCGVLDSVPVGPLFEGDPLRVGAKGLAVDSAGNLFVSTSGRVQRFSPDGTTTTVAGGGAARNQEGVPATSARLSPWLNSVALDAAGSLYVTNDDRVLKVTGLAATPAVPGPACDAPFDRPVWGTGWNGLGALGDSSSPGRVRTDTDHPPLTGVTAVAGGAFHSLALKADGTVWAWGWNGYGQLGDGSTTSHTRPSQVPGLAGVTVIAAGWVHNLAVTGDGSVWAWGWNNVGQLGDGSTTTSLVPKRVATLTGVTGVSASAYNSIAVKADGSVASWGWNGFGQLGDGTRTERHRPVRVAGLGGVTSAQAGVYHTMARTSDGSVWSWGWNGFGQVGDGTTADRHTPVRVGLSDVTAIAAGAHHGLAVRSDGTIWAWGWNGHGQLGHGAPGDSATPVRLYEPFRARSVAAGLAHSVAVAEEGTLHGWGWNAHGQLGIGSTNDTAWPWRAWAIPHASAVAAGAAHTLVVFDLTAS